MSLILPTRRDFLKASTAAAAIAAVGVHTNARAADASKKLKIGYIGCGGRGTGAASQALQADSNVELWAMGDAFRDPIDKSLESLQTTLKDHPEKFNVAEERKFVGLDAYQKVIDSGVDVVILTTTPAFRPQHIKAAIDAGKHVFAEKPMAVDGPGLRSVIESAKKAKEKNLALVDGFVWRWTQANREAYKKVHEGAIGDILSIYSSYYTGSVDRYPKWNRANTKTDLEWQLRRWYYFTWLSGDHIVEQAIHSIDKMLWAMKDEPPASVVCVGGRQARPGALPPGKYQLGKTDGTAQDVESAGGEYGNIFDHFSAEFRWESGVKGYHYCRQIGRCYNANTDEVCGTKGVYQGESGSKRHVIVHSDNPWRYKAPDGAKDNGYQTEHDEMYASIRAGNPINTSDRFTKTTLTAIMARMAAYSGKEVTWKDAMESKESLFPQDLKWDTKLPVAPVAIPGVFELT
ncbi:MAG TPA: Gfo/Idh/MocA family oxidoreductase [Chthoniobacter sp.]|nr:Gfo/Idh/MocA family oxidoreductase [Chthoniobacter sp.]